MGPPTTMLSYAELASQLSAKLLLAFLNLVHIHNMRIFVAS